MSDHFDGPDFTSPGGDPRLDLTDLYLFAQPDDPARSVLVLDVNPFAAAPEFHPDAVHKIHVDTDGDTLTDVSFSIVFSPVVGGDQTATVYRAQGSKARGDDADGDIVFRDAPVSFGTEPIVTQAGDFRFFAGRRSEPFFFDIEGAVDNFNFTGHDTFIDADVYSIILELPNKELGAAPACSMWARLCLRKDGNIEPIDRVGKPGITNGFLEGEDKARYIVDDPSNDLARYRETFVNRLVDQSGYAKEEASQIVDMLLPDVLSFDTSQPSGFPNGRRLEDDTFDQALPIITKGALTTDGVGPHTDYTATFPYLGTPHMTAPPEQ